MRITILLTISAYYPKLLTLLILSSLCYNCVAEDVEEKVTINADGNADWLSFSHSPVDLYYLAVIEESLIKVVKEYVAKLDGEPEIFFRRYIADYDDSSLRAYENWNVKSNKKRDHVIHTNPLLSYRMLWRYVTDFPKIKNVLMTGDNGDILKNLSKSFFDPMFVWPSEKDLGDSKNNLLNLHFIYNLNVSEFSEGNVSGVVTNASLAAIHCFEIAQFAFRQNIYTLAIDWLEVADMKRLNPSGHPILDFLDEESIVELLEKIILAHDHVWEKGAPGFHNLFQYYNRINSKKAMRTQFSILQSEYTSKGDGVKNLSMNDITAFSTLCKGGNLQSENEKSKLYCWYESKIHPALYINPQKMELHSEEPYIFQVYDFIGNESIKFLKKTAIPVMERSTTSKKEITDIPVGGDGLKNEKHREYSQFRTSMYSWLEDEENYMELLHISEKIKRQPGLIESYGSNIPSTNYQVAIYATGGQYTVHIDWTDGTGLNLNGPRIGDRHATFMIYLNDVELGGHTVFTSVGVAVPPVKGSAIFWYNSLHNGKVDYRTWHGGCPVLLGEKWVVNKWIFQTLNSLNGKCTLNEDK